MGQKIGKGVRIRFGTLLSAKEINIGNNVSIGPFSVVRASKISIGNYSKIQPLAIVSCHTLEMHNHTHIAPLAIIKGEQSNRSYLKLGNHSRIFPFCWIDTGHGVEIGQHVGIGGHTLIFTHGVWPNYLDGASVSFGKVIIEDNVWIPWRVFILPGTVIGENSVVGGNSLLNKKYPANALIGGSPAKVIKEDITQTISDEKRKSRLIEILNEYFNYKSLPLPTSFDEQFNVNGTIVSIDNKEGLVQGAILIILNTKLSDQELSEMKNKGVNVIDHPNKTVYQCTKSKQLNNLVFYLRRYGVRLSINK